MTEQDYLEQHSGHHPCVVFYLYLHFFFTCLGLILLHFRMAPAWVCLYVYFPFLKLFYSILNVILGGIIYLV